MTAERQIAEATFRAYRGRFAPSPTGPLHLGSLVAAVASYLDARAHGGTWLLRMEDVDRPRTVPGAADEILRTLDGFGFEWDEDVTWQSEREELYQTELRRLAAEGLAYPCACSRKEIADSGLVAGDGALRYPGTCRDGIAEGRKAKSWRLRVNNEPIEFMDRCQGALRSSLETDVGDFILRRADGLSSYQLAVVVDDGAQGITDVVRGADLLASTARQIYLQRSLGLPAPRYLHFPVVAGADGEKLSKQTLAPAADAANAPAELARALTFLGQNPPTGLQHEPTRSVWQWALRHFHAERIPKGDALPMP